MTKAKTTKTTSGSWVLTKLTVKGKKPSKRAADSHRFTSMKAAKAFARNEGANYQLVNEKKSDQAPLMISFATPDPVELPGDGPDEKPAKVKKTPKKDDRPLVTALVRCSGIITPSGPTVTVIFADGSLAGKASYDSNAWSEFNESQHIQATFRVDEAKGKRMIKSAVLATTDQIEAGYQAAMLEAISLG